MLPPIVSTPRNVYDAAIYLLYLLSSPRKEEASVIWIIFEKALPFVEKTPLDSAEDIHLSCRTL